MLVKVKNRSQGLCVYNIPELGDRRNIRREFSPNEEKRIDLEELRALTYIPGGQNLLNNYLQIEEEEAINKLDMVVEPEYGMSKEDIQGLLTHGSLDSLLDCLDFAPEGVIDIIKDLAVTMPLNDSEKREAIKKATGFDVDMALLRMREAKEEDKDKKSEGKKQRRVSLEEETTPKRRVTSDQETSNYQPPKYNYIKK